MSARLYYYDFLNDQVKKDIPESTLNHIMNCPDCQAEIDRLQSLLAKTDNRLEDQQSRRNSAITTLLKFHFSYVDEPVTCSTVKPFLASLADPVLQLLIPTPITRHIDECRSCRDDLHTLQDLHLTHKQLCRLGQLLAEQPIEDTVSCSQAREAIPAVASMVFRQTNAEVLKHLSMCSDCRKELFRYREELRQKLTNDGNDQGTIPCDAVSPSDIYDYAFPYGIDPSDDEYAEFREPLASHLGGCPRCLAKVQELQKTIYSIVERPETEVVTVYHMDEPAEVKAESGADHARQGQTINFTARLKRTVLSPKVKPWLKTSAAAAAVVLVGFILMSNEPTVEADSLNQMLTAIEKARNLHISTFEPDKAEPTQEMWVSRSLGYYMLKNIKEVVLSDFTNQDQKVRRWDSNEIVKKDLPDGMLEQIEGNVAGFLNLIPRIPISENQKESNWSRVSDDVLRTDNENDKVYDLEWTETTSIDSSISFRRRYFIDTGTSLPNRIELYKKSLENNEYVLMLETVVEQISDSKMQTAIENVFP